MNARILIVEDDAGVAAVLRRMLEGAGYSVLGPVASGEEVVPAVLDLRPSLILMDIVLSGQINGIEAARQIPQALDVPVVYLTAHEEETLLHEAKKTRPYAYLIKPVEPLELKSAIEVALSCHDRHQQTLQSERKYRTLLETMNEGFGMVDTEGRWTYVNPRFCELLGFEAEEIIGRLGLEVVHEHYRHLHLAAFAERRSGKSSTYESPLQTRDGRLVPVLVSAAPSYDLQGRFVGAFAVFTDMTELRDTEHQLRLLRAAVDNSCVPTFGVQPGGAFWYVNEAASRSLGYSREELMDLSVHDVDPDHSQLDREHQWKRLKEQGRLVFESTHRRKDGTVFPVEVSSNYLNFNGREYEWAFAKDISERKSAETLLKTSLAQKETLLRDIHHRVKNNLAMIHSILGLQCGFGADESHVPMFEDAQNRIRSIATAHELLYKSESLAAIGATDYVDLLLSNLVDATDCEAKAVTIVRNLEEVSLELETAVPLGMLLTELVTNALKHAFPERSTGQITISLKALEQDEFELVVADNGVGLPSHIELGQTPSLGLELVAAYVDQLHGAIRVDRSDGTSFHIVFYRAGSGKS